MQVSGDTNSSARLRWASVPFFSVLCLVVGLSSVDSPLMTKPSVLPNSQDEGTLVQSTRARTVNVKARNVDVREVLQLCADQIGARLILGDGVSGPISIEARDSRLADVMDNLCTAYSCEWSVSEGASPSLVVRSSAL